MSKGNQAFTPKARLIQILGEHLIKDASVGLLELAKNSYDADATEVEILMSGLNTAEGKIVIRDNGCGMNLETFINKWMNPASGHKQLQKEKQERTRLGRLPLGEKGVGRFAAQQIGHRLKMFSKTTDTDQELYVEINWQAFEDHTKDLADVKINYESRSCHIFQYEKSGTVLEISGLKSEWKESDVKRVANSLKRMKSPFKGANDFNVKLKFENCPEDFSKYEDIEITDVLDKAHYKIFGIVDKEGFFEFEYESNIPGSKKIFREVKVDLTAFGNIHKPIKCGGFIVYLHHYNKNLAAKSGFSKKDIEELSGMSIYRDGIRILPYGERGNDWLKLDNRRIQQTEAIGNDTIIGMIEINQTEHLLLLDKTNREGLIENEVYHQLEALVLATVVTLENEKKKDKSSESKEKKPELNVRQAFDNVNTKLSNVAKQVEQSNDADAAKAATVLQNVGSEVDDIKKQVEQKIEDYEKTNKTLFHLAGTGLAAERFTHEFARLISGANIALGRLVKLINMEGPKIKKEVDTIRGALEALRNDIRLLGPMFYIKKVANEKELDVKQIIENTLSLHEHWLEEESIEVEVTGGNSFNVLMREGSCMQIFSNLIDNAIFWLSRKSELDKRKIKVIMDSGHNTVYISDSGPGVVARYKDKIFDPFFSMKGEEGRGLGLYIVKEILDEKNWGIFLINQDDFPGLLKGASLKVVFGNGNE